ncbi:protein TonB [Bacteroidia bacterium]|nr:protein TonB [Bacteroidia bacterium]
MELKKTPQADLENERTTFFLLGFTVVLATLFVLLEWSSEDTLPPVWEGLPSIVLENAYEYNGNKEMLLATQVEPEVKPELTVEKESKVVYEDYNIVTEVPDEVVTEFDSEEAPVILIPEQHIPQLPAHEASNIEPPVAVVDAMPQYPGGYAAMNRYLFNNLKYPASAISQGIEGRVWCSFIVNKDGTLANIQVEKSVYISLDQEAIRALQTMPVWIPGTVRGNPVRVKVYLPIVFKL